MKKYLIIISILLLGLIFAISCSEETTETPIQINNMAAMKVESPPIPVLSDGVMRLTHMRLIFTAL